LTGQSTAAASITPGPRSREWRTEPPAAQTRLLRGTRPLKRWRYVAAFDDELCVCAADVRIGFAHQTFWALLQRHSGELRERTRLLPRRTEVQMRAARHPGEAGLLRVRDRGVELELLLDEQAGIEALCAHGAAAVWTRKQAGIAARGTVSLDGGPAREVSALAVVDDTAGHHARVTEWRWSAGVGVTAAGDALAWNLVEGVNDPVVGSERAVWRGAEVREPAPVRFAPDLSGIWFADGSRMAFQPEAERSRRDRLLLLESDYRAPFGHFSGTLEGGIELARGSGVMEHHRARW
jgi:hypothetical protein